MSEHPAAKDAARGSEAAKERSTELAGTEPSITADSEAATQAKKFRRAEQLFLAALELPEVEQRAFVVNSEQEPEVQKEVLGMLGHAGGGEQRLSAAIRAGLDWVSEEPLSPTRLGAYKVLEELGRGGHSVVYLAERDDEHFRKRVAVKVVRPEVRFRELERRLERERQILAGLEHSHIARILDGGTTDQGAPFLVMELVEGEPITDYCRRHSLSTRRRLELFCKVCAAVHYAHQSLVLHRDLKPSNILVTAGDVPKLLDFGIAKMLEAPETRLSTGESLATLTGAEMRLLTPEYASPEQVLGKSLTTGSDVYSLGVLLHELLVGERPYSFDRRQAAEVERVVCEQVPERPSSAYRRLSESKAQWDSDLDKIVTMALRKEPERRYASVLQFSEDIRNYLHNLPVMAQADSLRYRAKKFVRRHRGAIAAAAIVIATLLAAVMVTSHQAGVADRERQRAEHSLASAEKQRQTAEEVVNFMVESFELANPNSSQNTKVTAREVLDQGARRISWQLHNRPLLRATLMTTMGRVYRRLDLYDDAESLLEEAMTVVLSLDGDRASGIASHEQIQGLRELGLLRLDQSRLERSEKLLRRSVRLAEQNHGAGSVLYSDHLMDLGLVLEARGRQAELENLLDEAFEIRQRNLGETDPKVSETRDRMAELAYHLGDYERAETLCRQALTNRRQALGDKHPDVIVSLNNLAAIQLALGDIDEAEQHFEEALVVRRRLFGDRHGTIAQSLQNLAAVKMRKGAGEQAKPLLDEALEVTQELYGAHHAEVAEVLYMIATLNQALNDRETAAAQHLEVLEIRRRSLGRRHPKVVQSLQASANLLTSQNPKQAENLYREAIDIQQEVLPQDDFRRAYTYLGLGQILFSAGEFAEAQECFEQAFDLRTRALTAGHRETAVARAHLGRVLLSQGHNEEGHEHLSAALQSLENAGHPLAERVRSWLAPAR